MGAVKAEYMRLPQNEEERERRRSSPVNMTPLLFLLACFIVVALMIASGLAGFYLRSHLPTQNETTGWIEPSGQVEQIMKYNHSYAISSPEADIAWDAMFPDGLGFVKHPVVATELSGLAVFHELHCVNVLRVGFWAAFDGTWEEKQLLKDHNRRPDMHHIRHCFDYLRQSLMCMADTNLEPVDMEVMGATGWGFQRTCRDFDGLRTWAAEWKSWETTGQVGV
ncbi:hypothetical protein MMC10_003525 [Thelotrema lepadinum]|nr:hypothetical protein [Thelotrema lepadinum]